MGTMSTRTLVLALATIGELAVATPDDPVATWYGPPVPGLWNLERSDMGLAGSSEPASALVDGLSGGGRGSTRIGLSFQRDRADLPAGSWSLRQSGFDLGAILNGAGGLSFGVEALNIQPEPSAQSSDARWSVREPQGGMRLGAAADALHPWHDKDWTWGFGFWAPIYSSGLEWEFMTGLVHARRFRADVSFGWNRPSTPALLEKDLSDTTRSDTLWWRTRQKRWSLRLGASPFDGLALQAWGGKRWQDDPGNDGDPGWRLWGSSWFSGTQATWESGFWTLDLEIRCDQGRESATFDTAVGFGWMAPSGARGHATHSLADGRIELLGKRALSTPLRPLLAAQCSWMRLDGFESGSSVEAWDAGGTWGELHRWEGEVGFRCDLPWLSIEPRLGLQRREMEGDPPRLWWGFPTHATTWSLPWKVRLFREGIEGTSLSYRISGEIHASGSSSYHPGLRQEASIGQAF
jgi:hypothetical protein